MSYDYEDDDLYSDGEEVDVCICHECNQEFEVEVDSNPDRCPNCGIVFD